MYKERAAQSAIVEVIFYKISQGGGEIDESDLIEEAMQIPQPTSRLHNLGDSVLKIFGRKVELETDDYKQQLYKILPDLEGLGLVRSKWVDDPTTDSKTKRQFDIFTEEINQ